MDCVEVKGPIPMEEQLEPLVIIEEGDEQDDFLHSSTKGKGILRVKKEAMEDKINGNSVESTDSKNVEGGEPVHVTITREELENQQKEGSGSGNRKMEGTRETEENADVSNTQTEPLLRMEKVEGELQGLKTDALPKAKSPADDTQPSAHLRPKDLLSPVDAQLKVRRLSPDSPDALYELLCALQEGRRLNDQRCSFTLQPRRRCHSEPGTPRHTHKVVFSSMTSLQKEEFFDFLATSQARRLDDQRADFQSTSPETPVPLPQESRRPSSAPASFSQPRPKSRRSSWKVMEFGQAAPKPAAKEELYNMILTSQAQGRLEEQRSKAPGPMDDEDFFSLLLKVQGGRMDEQRTELPLTLRD